MVEPFFCLSAVNGFHSAVGSSQHLEPPNKSPVRRSSSEPQVSQSQAAHLVLFFIIFSSQCSLHVVLHHVLLLLGADSWISVTQQEAVPAEHCDGKALELF